jgi:hypothetical protein
MRRRQMRRSKEFLTQDANSEAEKRPVDCALFKQAEASEKGEIGGEVIVVMARK